MSRSVDALQRKSAKGEQAEVCDRRGCGSGPKVDAAWAKEEGLGKNLPDESSDGCFARARVAAEHHVGRPLVVAGDAQLPTPGLRAGSRVRGEWS